MLTTSRSGHTKFNKDPNRNKYSMRKRWKLDQPEMERIQAGKRASGQAGKRARQTGKTARKYAKQQHSKTEGKLDSKQAKNEHFVKGSPNLPRGMVVTLWHAAARG